MLATGPLLTSADRNRFFFATINKLRDETPVIIVPQLYIQSIQRESYNEYNVANDASVSLIFTVDGGPSDQGITVTLAGMSKTQARGSVVTFTGLNEHAGYWRAPINTSGDTLTITDHALNIQWTMTLYIAYRYILYNSNYYYIGQYIKFTRPYYITPRVYIQQITRETPNFYSSADDASITLALYIDGGPADTGCSITVHPITKTSSRGTSLTFNSLDEHYGPRLITVSDNTTKFNVKMLLNIAEQSVTYNGRKFYAGQSIIFNPYNANDDGAIYLTVSNIRTGFASISCAGRTFAPINIPTGATKLKDQVFQITNLDGNITTPYTMLIKNPYTNKTYSLSATIGFKRDEEPVYPIRSSLTYQNVKYGEGDIIRLK